MSLYFSHSALLLHPLCSFCNLSFSSGNLSPTAQTQTALRNVCMTTIDLFFHWLHVLKWEARLWSAKTCCFCVCFQCRVPVDQSAAAAEQEMTWRSPWFWWDGWCWLCSCSCFAHPVSGVPVQQANPLDPTMSVPITLCLSFNVTLIWLKMCLCGHFRR